MKMAVRRLADVLGAYARREGWWPLAFRLYYRADGKWGKIHFIFVSDGFEGRNETESYRSIMDYVRMRIHDDQDLVGALGLVLRSFKQMSEGGIYSIGRSYAFVRPRDLVKRAIREVASLIVKFATDHGWEDLDYIFLYRIDSDSSDLAHLILFVPKLDNPPDSNRFPIKEYVSSRLFDEPDLVSSFALEVRETEAFGQDEINSLKESGFRDYFSFSRSK
jgi:hypothetical protein